MEFAKTVNALTAMDMVSRFKKEVESLEIAIELMEEAHTEVKHIDVLKELKIEFFSRQKDLENKLKKTEISLL